MLRVFRLPAGAATTLLTGLTGGYPVGARGIRTLWESGILNTEQAKRMLLFCLGAGPGFLVSVVGERLLHSRTAGLLLFVAQILSALLLGIFLARFAPLPDVSSRTKTPHSASLPFSEAMVHAVSDAARSMLSLCSFVVFFGAMLPLAESSGILSVLRRILCTIGLPAEIASSFLSVVWEVSGAVQSVCELVPFSAALLGFSVGFGGLCTQFQIFSAAGAIPFSHRLFFLFRLLHGLLTAGFTALFFSRLPEHSLPVFSGNSAPAIQARSTSFPLMSALLVLCFVFLLVIPQNSAENPRICPRNAHRIS